MLLLIIGDPKGTHVMTALDKGYKPENIWVWENDSRHIYTCLLYTSPSPRDATLSRMPSSA